MMSSYLSGRSFDCGTGLTTEADSSGLYPISSPSASSDSSSTSSAGAMATLSLNSYLKTKERAEPFVRPVPVAPGKDLRLMTAPNQDELPSNPLPARRQSALLLSKFQEQMSLMKDAMDAVQKELSDPPPRSRGRPPNQANPTYHSQIATTNGLVIKIRKGVDNSKTKQSRVGVTRKGGGAKKKRKRVDEDIVYCGEDSEVEEVEEPRKRRKEVKVNSHQHHHQNQTGGPSSSWGTALPLSLLRRILGLVVVTEGAIPFLVRASRVSRLWREATLDPGLWTSIDLSTGKVKDKYRSERNLIYFLENKFSEARTLNLGGWSSAVTPGAVDVLVNVCPHLTSLNLSTCNKLNAHNVRSIAESCSRLSSLDLSAVSSVYNTKNAVSPSGIGEATEIFGHRLLHLSLASNCLGNLPQVLTSLAENCGSLGVLDLSNINSPRRDAILIRIEQLQIGCPALKVLRLTNSDIVLGETSIKDQVNSPGFVKLEELSIAVDPKKSQGMDNNDLERIVKNSHRLRLLDARGCARISDSGLIRLPAWDLEHLYLSGSFATKSSRDGLELIFRKWTHSLICIDISWTPSEEAIGLALKALSEGDTDALRSLDLSGSSISFDSVKLLLLRTAPSLQSLNLTSCRALPRGLKRNYTTREEVQTLRQQVSKT